LGIIRIILTPVRKGIAAVRIYSFGGMMGIGMKRVVFPDCTSLSGLYC
jgi:hypothetical protein